MMQKGLLGNAIDTQYMVVTSKESQDILWEICHFPPAPFLRWLVFWCV